MNLNVNFNTPTIEKVIQKRWTIVEEIMTNLQDGMRAQLAEADSFFWGTFFVKNLVWTPFLRPGTWKIGFLVENYVYSLIPRSKLDDLGPNTSKFIF